MKIMNKKNFFLSKGFVKCEELGKYLKDFVVSLLPMDLFVNEVTEKRSVSFPKTLLLCSREMLNTWRVSPICKAIASFKILTSG